MNLRMNLSERLFCSTFARAEIENMLEPSIPDWCDWHLSWDYYDDSIELHGMPLDWKISTGILQKLFDEGFQRVWVNYSDKSEKYYAKAYPEGWNK